MALAKETYTAADEIDYRTSDGAAVGIKRTDAYKGVAARYNGGIDANNNRPIAVKTNAVNQIIIGFVTHVGAHLQCRIVKRGRCIVQANAAYNAANDFGDTIETTTTVGKVVAANKLGSSGAFDRAFVEGNDWTIVGGGNDTSEGGIGHYYIVERFQLEVFILLV